MASVVPPGSVMSLACTWSPASRPSTETVTDSGMCVASASTGSVLQHVLQQVAARRQLALGVDRDLDLDLLAALDQQQVDVLQEALRIGVALHGLRDGQLASCPRCPG